MVGRRGHSAGRRRIGLVAGAIAFLCQMLAWAWYPPAALADSAVILICSPDGMAYRSVPPDTAALLDLGAPDGGTLAGGAPAGDDASDMAGHGCPLCPLVTGLSLPPPPIEIAPPTDLARHGSVALPGGHIAAGWFLSSLQARAPPAG